MEWEECVLSQTEEKQEVLRRVAAAMLQSRPTKQGLGDYMFLVDIEGHVNEPALQTALNFLRLKLREVKVLGCYPVD